MVSEGIIPRQCISKYGLEVDQANIEVIENFPPQTNVDEIRNFLGHDVLYRRFI